MASAILGPAVGRICCDRYCLRCITPNSPYSLLRAIRPRGRSRHLAVLAQPVQGLMLTEAAQFEMADFKDRCRNFCGKSTSHEQWPANILEIGRASCRERV